MFSKVDTEPRGQAHHSPRSPGQCSGTGEFIATHQNRQQPSNPNRRHINSLGMAKRVKNTRNQHTHLLHGSKNSNKGHSPPIHAHSRTIKQKGRLAFQTPRPQVISIGQGRVSQNMHTFQFPATSGPVCQQKKQTSQNILLMEGGQGELGQCLPDQLAPLRMLAQPSMGTNS